MTRFTPRAIPRLVTLGRRGVREIRRALGLRGPAPAGRVPARVASRPA